MLDYYLAIQEKNFQRAFGLLGGGMRSGMSYDSFVRGFATTRDVRVEDLEVLKEGATDAIVRVEISTLESDGTNKRFGGSWNADRSSGKNNFAPPQQQAHPME